MISEPRTINLLTDLLHIPVKAPVDNLRAVYNAVCKSCGYENFIRTADGARIERGPVEDGPLQGNQVSTVTFRHDRIQLLEDHNTMSLDEYVRKVEEVARAAMKFLNLPFFLVQQNTIRATVSPNCFKNAADFLSRSFFRIDAEGLEPLGRPTNVVGFRLLFPPTQEQPQKFNVRIESYLKDPRSIYIENVATYQAPIQKQNLELLGQNIEAAAGFVSVNVCEFLTQYDRKDPKP